MSEARARVLVLDGFARAAVEAVQSLGRRGLHVVVAAPGDCPAWHSRWAAERLLQPATADSAEFITWLRGAADGCALVVPSTELSLVRLADLPDNDPLRALAALPSADALFTALDKGRTVELAQSLGVAVPASGRPAQPTDPLHSPLPTVLKPVHSVVRRNGALIELSPALVRNAEERRDTLHRMLAQSSVLEQEMVPGVGVGVECLYDRGRLVWHFAHRRLHEGTGGGLGSGSWYRSAIEPPPELLAATTALLGALKWHGLAMVEFKLELATGRWWLMEINPRLWGSVALAIDAGVDFPYGLYQVATGRDPGPQPAYRHPYYTRLVAQDLDWIAREIRRDGLSRAVELVPLLRVMGGRESWDHFAWTDPAPLARSAWAFIQHRRAVRAAARQLRAAGRAALTHHEENVSRLAATGRDSRIMFVCTGNICRSPLAEALWRSQFPQTTVSSSGFIQRAGRQSPENVQSVAQALGTTLVGHTSRVITEAMVRESDVIVLFDSRNFVDFRAAFPDSLHKIVMLGGFLRPSAESIQDPYQLSAADTQRIAAAVRTALGGLAQSLGLQAAT